MQAGRLRNSVTVTRKGAATQNAFGEDVFTYDDLVTQWAEIRAMDGRELEAAQQTFAEARFKIVMRDEGTDFRRADRITWGTRTLEILDVEDPDTRNREFHLVCREYVQ